MLSDLTRPIDAVCCAGSSVSVTRQMPPSLKQGEWLPGMLILETAIG